MSATKFGLLATAAASAITAAAITSQGNALKVYAYAPRDVDSLPAVTIDGPTAFTRTDPDEPESQLGSYDWRMSFELTLYVGLDDPEQATVDARAILGQLIAAIDADSNLGGEADLGASIVDGAREYAENDNGKQMLLYVCSLDIWALVA